MISSKLRYDLQREQEYYAEHSDCDNVSFLHLARRGKYASYYVDRFGENVYVFKKGRVSVMKKRLQKCVNYYKKDGTKVLKQKPYYILTFTGPYHITLHRLIADVFLDNNDFILTEVDHKDGQCLNNNALNLERVSPEENRRRRYYHYFESRGKPIPDRFQTPTNYVLFLNSKL